MQTKERLYYMDWLRILAILFVFLVHCAMPFGTVEGVWLVQFDQTDIAFTMFAGFTFQWVMELFFFLAGAGTRLALSVRTRRQYLGERARRLLVPFLFGSLAFTALQQYFSALSRSQHLEPFTQFYLKWYTVCVDPPSLGILSINCLSSHLWFLGYLFLFSVLTFPLIKWSRTKMAEAWTARMTTFSQKPGRILVFCLPMAVVQASLKAHFPHHQDWSDFLIWLIYFALGYLFINDQRFMKAIVRHRYAALGAGLVCMITMSVLLLNFGYADAWEINPVFSSGYAFYQVLRSFNTWLWVLFFLGTAAQHLEFDHSLLRYSRQALLPFYILHQVIIVLLAYVIFHWHPPLIVKFLTLTLGAFALTIGLYEFLVRRVTGLRILFGMR